MAGALNLAGRRFGLLVVVEPDPAYRGQGRAWVCQCDCGARKTVRAKDLGTGNTKSCGCHRKAVLARQHGGPQPHRVKDLTGRRFGALVVVERAGFTAQGAAAWRCRCDCGGSKIASGPHLTVGDNTTCGCRISRRPEWKRS